MPSRTGLNETDRWIKTSATIVSCRYQFARVNTLTLGIQTGQKFRIAFEYYAHGRLYSGGFESPVAIEQNATVPLWYNPLRPQENTYTAGPAAGGGAIAIGVAASILVSLVCLGVLRGCG